MDQLAQAAPALLQVVGQAGSAVAGSQASSANQRFAKVEAQQAIINAGIEERQSRRRAAQILSKQQAIAAASGLDTSSGTPLEVMLDSARQAEEEALLIRAGGEAKARAIKAGAALESSRASSAAFGGLAGAGLTLAQNRSVLGDLWRAATGSSANNSGWASSVPAGRFSISGLPAAPKYSING